MGTNLRLGILVGYILSAIGLLMKGHEMGGISIFAITSFLLLFASSKPSKPKFVAPMIYKEMKSVGKIAGSHYVYSTLSPTGKTETSLSLDGGVTIMFIRELTASNPPHLVDCYFVLDKNGNEVWPPQK